MRGTNFHEMQHSDIEYPDEIKPKRDTNVLSAPKSLGCSATQDTISQNALRCYASFATEICC